MTLHRTAQTAAGVTKELKFPDYVSLLLEQAQVHDAGNTNTTNPQARQSVNTHDLIFEGADPDDDAEYKINQIEIHDEETPIEYLINRNEQGQKPRRTRIDYNTWKNLQKHDQEAWNKMSDEAKEAILSYAMKNMSGNKGVLKNSEKRTRFSSDKNRPRRANTHEQTNDDNPTEDNSPPTIEASTHQILPKTHNKANVPHSSNFDNILTMAKTKTTSKSNPNAHITIDKILASEANAHEQYYTRSDYHLEAFVHKVNIDGYEYDVESEDEEDYEYELQEEYVEEDDDDETFDYTKYLDTSFPQDDEVPVIDLLDSHHVPIPPANAYCDINHDLISFEEDDDKDEDSEEDDPEETYAHAKDPYYSAVDEEPFDYTAYLADNLRITDDYVDDLKPHMGVEESKDDFIEGPAPETMKSPFDFILKPTPMASRITLSDDHTRFIYTKDESLLEEHQEEDEEYESPSSVNDLEEYLASQVAENSTETKELDDHVPQVTENEPKFQDLENKTEDPQPKVCHR